MTFTLLAVPASIFEVRPFLRAISSLGASVIGQSHAQLEIIDARTFLEVQGEGARANVFYPNPKKFYSDARLLADANADADAVFGLFCAQTVPIVYTRT